MSSPPVAVTAIIHTLNSAATLALCLESVKDQVEEILICDMYSEDDTLAIAERFGARVIFHDRTGGIVEPAREFAIAQATHPWILVLDSDEAITPDLLTHLRQETTRPDAADQYRLPVQNIIFGKPLRAAWPDYQVRFFKKAQFVSWPREVHRGAYVYGSTIKLPPDPQRAIIHHSYPTIRHWVDKNNRYTDFEVAKLADYRPSLGLWWYLLARPVGEFLKRYLFKSGWRDGYEGFIFSALMAHYKFLAIAKLWESRYKGG